MKNKSLNLVFYKTCISTLLMTFEMMTTLMILNFQATSTTRNVCGLGSAHKKAPYFRLNYFSYKLFGPRNLEVTT
jgi:hypothetical protein